jgi:hypothetical protein
MSRWLVLGSVLSILGIGGCGGYSEEEAEEHCTEEREARNAGGAECIDDGAFASCRSAYEECGDDAYIDDSTCPVTFACNDD